VEEIVCLITSFVEGLTFPLDLSGCGMGRRTPLFRSYVHDAEMAVNLSTAPSDEDIAILWPHTLHSRWGQEGFMGGISTKGDDFVSRCSMCGKNRRDRWEKEPY